MIKGEHVSAGYDKEPVVKNVCFAFEPGKIHVILGKNGSGKSTLLKSCLNLLKLQSGKIEIDGEDVSKMPPKYRAHKMSMVSQSRTTPCMQAFGLVLHGRFCYLSWPRTYSSKDLQAAWLALEEMNAKPLAARNLQDLSGGEKQKVYLAQALCQDSDILFFDEPTTYLDMSSQMEMFTLAKKLAAQNKCIVLVLHDLASALEYADHIILMDQGCKVFDGGVQELLDSGWIEKIFHVRCVMVRVKGRKKYVVLEEEDLI